MPDDRARALLRRMAEGDESALADLYDEWGQRVHTLALWILEEADEAEDVVEETFWQAWQTAGQHDVRRGAGSTWLMMIARSRAIDRLRSRRRREGWITKAKLLEEAMSQPGPGPEEGPEIAERRTVLATALAALPVEQRDALELAYFKGLSHAEIAAETGLPVGTVKTRIRLAMQKLREQLVSLEKGDL